jgi:hypoxanthine phosphoribosyltransferase
MDITQIRQVWQEADCLYSANEVKNALCNMAAAISASLHEANPLCLCVMSGSVVFTGQLLPLLNFPLELDYIHASRYRGATRGSTEMHWYYRPRTELAGRTVLVLDDILDEGLTLQAVLDYCRNQGAATVLSAVLVDKQRPRAENGLQQANFTGLLTPDRYLFGYGLDYHEYLRNADGIYAVKGM